MSTRGSGEDVLTRLDDNAGLKSTLNLFSLAQTKRIQVGDSRDLTRKETGVLKSKDDLAKITEFI